MARYSRSKTHRRRSRRRVAVRRPKKTLRVFCEGERTEPDYLRALRSDPSIREVASVEIQMSKHTIGITPPLTLVEEAVGSAERVSQERGEVDEVWCLFDVESPDNHPNLPQALGIARRGGVKVAVSNPCFELWLVLHFRDCKGWLATRDAERLRQQLDGSRDKGVEGATYMPRRNEAAERARALDKQHRMNGKRLPNDNPSSGMYLLLDTITRVN